VNYDALYRENPDYFGRPFPELLEWFSGRTERGYVLDIGCGQGRNALPLAEMGYKVHAIDVSEVAIRQLESKNDAWRKRNKPEGHLAQPLTCRVADLREITNLYEYHILLLDGFFQFHDHSREFDRQVMNHLIEKSAQGTLFVFCFADREDSIEAFAELTSALNPVQKRSLYYTHRDPISEWEFETRYRMEVLRKDSGFSRIARICQDQLHPRNP
jgi:SAM-dependent methyltransferase